MVRCSSPVVAEVLRPIKPQNSRACPTPCSTEDQTNTSFEMCQNSNDFCFENNSFAKKSQQKPAKGFLTQRRKDAKETAKDCYLKSGRLCAFAALREKSHFGSMEGRSRC